MKVHWNYSAEVVEQYSLMENQQEIFTKALRRLTDKHPSNLKDLLTAQNWGLKLIKIEKPKALNSNQKPDFSAP